MNSVGHTKVDVSCSTPPPCQRDLKNKKKDEKSDITYFLAMWPMGKLRIA